MKLKKLLTPFSILWENIYEVRRKLFRVGFFKSYKASQPVISIGNLTFGGTGKTPFTLWLAKQLESLDLTSMILMRGYKGELENSHGVLLCEDRFNDDATLFGDEPTIYSKKLSRSSVVVGRNRVANLKYYQPRVLPDVILLDDGHQHLKISRDLDIVLFDSLMPLDQYQAAPLGYMREGFEALEVADIVIIGRSDLVPMEQLNDLENLLKNKIKKEAILAHTNYLPSKIVDKSFTQVMEPNDLNEKDILCISGVASPASFHAMVNNLGANIVETESYPDHHQFTLEEVRLLEKKALELDVIILTTEKDMVKLSGLVSYELFYCLEINVNFLKGEKEVIEIIKKVI